MEKTFDPQAIETTWYNRWEKANYFKPSGSGEPYCIMIPPPNVTGTLHMGHGFQYSLMDALIRYHRMCGFNTLWQVGTDHAGIATQLIVERQLEAKGTSRHDIGREKFLAAANEWKNFSGNLITKQMRRLGIAVDWSRERFTLDDGLSRAVREVFIRLFDEGLIYRGQRLVNWDPKLKTAVSDLEVLSEEQPGQLWFIRYPLVDDAKKYVVVATSRPETLFGDVAVAVHPDDERFKSFIGKKVKLPLTDREIPIIADDFVETEFGSGCVKITPAHDFNDYAVGLRHQLPMINILNPDATLNDEVPQRFRKLDRFVAREQAVKELTELGLIEKIENYTIKMPKGDRSGVMIEPFLTHQWFVNAKPLAEAASKVVENGEVKFVPDNWKNTYFHWMNNIQDWCISRQLWWGHRIPAWYDDQGNIYVAHDEKEVRQKYQLNNDIVLHQDDDVLDTWFSSALWPFSTLGWPDNTEEFQTFYPTNVLVTGFDIIFFWVARMIMMGLKFTDKVPFHEVYITGLIRDHDGQKMSKSKGNVLDPLDLIDGIDLDSLVKKRTENLLQPHLKQKIEAATKKQFPKGIPPFGTDALRFTFCALATTGRDIRFDLGRIEGYRNFCNKLWNASRYVLMNCEDKDLSATPEYSLVDQWIQSQLQTVIEQAHRYFKEYRFDLLAQTLYEFIWNEYCDWYLELSKPVLTNPDATDGQKCGTRRTLLEVLETILRLMHPLMPFITEEIWHRVAPLLNIQGATIQLQAYPVFEKSKIDINAEAELVWLKAIIMAIRNIRGEMNISPAQLLSLYYQHDTEFDKQRFDKHGKFLMALAKLNGIYHLSLTEQPPFSATALVGEMKLFVPMEDFIDKKSEIARLQKEVDKLQTDLTRAEERLANTNYVSKAPKDVVERERLRVHEWKASITKLEEQMEQLNSL